MSLLDFSDTPKQAFAHGFWKGLAAPVMLFGNFNIPERRTIKPLVIQRKNDTESLCSDWHNIGKDFNQVIEAHGKKARTSTK